MTRAIIVCDASFDKNLLLTGYAGCVHICDQNDVVKVKKNYSGCSASFEDSNKGEMVAVFNGLRLLKTLLKKNNISLDGLSIYTDSQTTIDAYEAYISAPNTVNPLYTGFMQRLKKEMDSMLITPEIKHVKAHVPDHIASPIEILHNEQDAAAVKARNTAMFHIFHPDKEGSPWYAVVLPAFGESEIQAQEMKAIAVALASSGRRARIAIEIEYKRPHEHPYIEALNHYAAEKGVDSRTLYYLVQSSPPKSFDATILMHHILVQGEHSAKTLERERLNSSPSTQKSAKMASELIYGPLSALPSRTGRAEKASVRLFDLTRIDTPDEMPKTPYSISEWLDKLSEYVALPHRFGFDAIKRFAKLDAGEKPARRRARRHIALLEVLTRYGNTENPQALSNRMTDILIEFGAPDTPEFKDKMARYIMLHPHKHTSPGTMVADVERKLSSMINAKTKPPREHGYVKRLKDLSSAGKIDLNALDPFSASIVDAMLTYGPYLEKPQLITKLVDVIVEQGYSSSPYFREALSRNLNFITPGLFSNPELMATHCAQQAKKFNKHLSPSSVESAKGKSIPETEPQENTPPPRLR